MSDSPESYKDRMALAMIEGAERSGRLRRGMRVVDTGLKYLAGELYRS